MTRPCPFCKSKDVSVGGARLPEGVLVAGQDFIFFAQCDNCLARGPVQAEGGLAMEAWNKGVRN